MKNRRTAMAAHLRLPRMVPCNRLGLDAPSVLVLAAGFEDRRVASVRKIVGPSAGKAIVLDYLPRDEKNDLPGLLNELGTKGLSGSAVRILQYDRFNPHSFPGEFKALLAELSAYRMVLDVSAMSRLAIMLCMDIARELNLDLDIFYAEAQRYRPSRQKFRTAWKNRDFHRPSIQIYTGVHRVIRVPRLSSVAMQGQPTAAIAFMSFDEELTQALLNAVYPSRLLLVNGCPPKLRWRETATAWIHERLRKEWGEEDNPVNGKMPVRATSTRDYRQTVALLLGLYWELAVEYRVLLAPTGSKMQTVGCYLVRALHPDIHIEYPTPFGFVNPETPENCETESASIVDSYSSGIGNTWILHFSRFGDWLKELYERERNEHLGLILDMGSSR